MVTIAFSCSSPISSVAVLEQGGHVVFEASEAGAHNASGICLRLLEHALAKTGMDLRAATYFAADLGPGSFIGSRVAVTLAKTLAFATGVSVLGAQSFDLIDSEHTVAVPSKKGEFFVRRPGEAPFRTVELPEGEEIAGYGAEMPNPTYPNAARFASLLKRLEPLQAEKLLPQYLIEPSISSPKISYGQRLAPTP